ncbi:fimbria/pilus outer membrane usher protein [Providencia vermicola]|uniref:fimbria/pilus outer membrane usher protein n=1 Tax=Providencia vermicola TaxID=333965 RepID=UPI002AB354E2|nr:fimbrial biogenesis outer membrane usher protein [Providencia stuartii]
MRYFSLLSSSFFFSAAALGGVTASQATSSAINFDIDSLKSLGYGAEIADFFKQGSQFLPGQHNVTLRVNSSTSYSSTVLIGQQGQLCVDKTLQHTLKLKAVSIESECATLEVLYPSAKVVPHPNDFAIEVLLPESAFDSSLKGDELTRGGMALMSNYRIYGMQMTGWETQQFYQGQFELGANWQNWILRNQSSLSSGKNKAQYQFNETTVSRNLESLSSQLQFGQISTQGNLFGGTPLLGAQVYSDSSLRRGQRLIVPVTGIAETPATVEVHQNGRLLYRTLVPAGPFQLDKINHVVTGQPLEVTVLQEDGQRQQFKVTTSVENEEKLGPLYYQFALGHYRVRHSDEHVRTPLVGSIEGGISKGNSEYTAGTLFSEPYQSIGGRVNTQWGNTNYTGVNFGVTASRDDSTHGVQVDSAVSQSFENISIGLSSLYRTQTYPTLDESLQKGTKNNEEDITFERNNGVVHSSSSASLGWSHPQWGRISYTLNYNHYYGQQADETLSTISYGKKFGNITTNLSYQSGNSRDSRLSFNASMPFGQRSSVSMQMQRYQQETQLTSTFNHRPGDLWGYSVGATQSQDQTRLSGGINMTTAYSQIAANGSWSDENSRSMMFSASGALAYSDGMVATSPRALGDTFGIVSIPGQSGVRVSALGSGTTVTNHFGTAAIPTLPTQLKTTVQLDTKDLPLNVRLDTTSFDVAVARGTVLTHRVNATVMKQLLLGITLANGKSAPVGASVLNQEEQLIGVVMNNGSVMLSNEQIGQPIILRIPNQSDCMVDYPVPAVFDANALYEEAAAICK